MEKIAELIDSKTFFERKEAKATQRELDPLSILVVNRLFVFFEAVCRGFDKQYHDAQKKLDMEKIQWAKAFMDSGISRIEQVELGVKKCRLASPINTPTINQFLSWCKPSEDDFKLLPKESAYVRAFDLMRDGHISGLTHEQLLVINHAINQSDRHFLKTNPRNKTEPVFYRNYDIAVRDFLDGPLKPISIGLENKTNDTMEKAKQDEIAKNYKEVTSNKGFRDSLNQILGDVKWTF